MMTSNRESLHHVVPEVTRLPSSSRPADFSLINPTMAGFSANALRDYALVKSPSTQISPSTLLLDSPGCIAIFDAYPKAKYHFLILPRYPFPHKCSIDYLHDLSSLLRAPKEIRKAVVEEVRSMAGEVVEMIKDEMMKTEGFTWGVDLGFHAVPSMRYAFLEQGGKGLMVDISTYMSFRVIEYRQQ